jgi:hypothetical protein
MKTLVQQGADGLWYGYLLDDKGEWTERTLGFETKKQAEAVMDLWLACREPE